MIEPKNKKSLETGTGIAWSKWLVFFDEIGAKSMDHTTIARRALEEIKSNGDSKSPEWWAQGVTVAYEQAIGRRRVGERSDGKFSVTVSKTVSGDMDQALQKWDEKTVICPNIQSIVDLGTVRTSETDKWRYWRSDALDGSKISVNFQTKPTGDKTSISVNHDGLPNAEAVEPMREFWRKCLEK